MPGGPLGMLRRMLTAWYRLPHTACLPCLQMSAPPRMAMMNMGNSAERQQQEGPDEDDWRPRGGIEHCGESYATFPSFNPQNFG